MTKLTTAHMAGSIRAREISVCRCGQTSTGIGWRSAQLRSLVFSPAGHWHVTVYEMRDIIVIGAPSGGAAALATLVARLPLDLAASVFIVLHSDPQRPILLSDVLNAPGRLRAAEAIDGEPVMRGRIYVAADGKHLMLRRGKVHLSPRTANDARCPSINVLFTSAAMDYNVRVIGVLLLHAKEDGWLGLQAIQKAGGRTVTHRNEHMPEEPTDMQTAERLCGDHLELEQIVARVLFYYRDGNGSTKQWHSK
jgi:two-component system, chemotaxis family, protein-glutamate methylesterase/glutaminase